MATCKRCGAETTQSTIGDTFVCADCRETLADRDETRPEGQLGLGDLGEDSDA
jgi:hypothetical protein